MALEASSRRVDIVGEEVVEPAVSTQQKLSIWVDCIRFRHCAAHCREAVVWVCSEFVVVGYCVLAMRLT